MLAIRIDQSSKIPATAFLRAMDAKYGTSESIINEFHKGNVKTVKASHLKPEMYSVSTIVDEESGEELVRAGCQIGDAVGRIQNAKIKDLKVLDKITTPHPQHVPRRARKYETAVRSLRVSPGNRR